MGRLARLWLALVALACLFTLAPASGGAQEEGEPAPEPAVPATPTPPPPPAQDVAIADVEWTPRQDKLLFLARNPNTHWWMPYSSYTIYVFGEDGALLSTKTGLLLLGPGEQTYEVAMGLITGPKRIGKVEVQVQPRAWRPASTFPGLAPVEIAAYSYEPAVLGGRIFGTLVQRGPRAPTGVTVTTALRDARGKLLDVYVGMLPQVAPNAPAEFSFMIVGAPSSPAVVEIQAREHPNHASFSLSS